MGTAKYIYITADMYGIKFSYQGLISKLSPAIFILSPWKYLLSSLMHNRLLDYSLGPFMYKGYCVSVHREQYSYSASQHKLPKNSANLFHQYDRN